MTRDELRRRRRQVERELRLLRAEVLERFDDLLLELQTLEAAECELDAGAAAASAARSEKLKDVPRADRRSSNEDPLSTKADNRTVTALAKEAGVSRPTEQRP